MQIVGLDDLVMKELYKHVSVNLCPNTLVQVIYYIGHSVLLCIFKACRPNKPSV